MFGVALLLTVATVGVDYGWQPGEDGQLEYIIQIEPELVKTLSEGKVDLLSEIPEELQGVKRFRIRVGTGQVPRKGLEEAQAANIRPADDIAHQQPNLNGGQFPANDPRAVGTQRPTDTRGSPALQQPGAKVLNPPARATDNTQPLDTDRFTDSTAGGRFPTVGQTPGIGRNAPQPRGSNDPTEPLNDRTPLDFNNNSTPRTATPVWDAATQQWRTPQAAPGTNTSAGAQDPRNLPLQDPRYAATDPRTGLPEVRRDTAQDPRAYNPAYAPNANYPAGNYATRNNPPAQWNGQPNYNTAPLRDPDQGYYQPPNYASRPEAQYDPNIPMNRQVGYQVAANPNTGTPPAANPAAPGTTNTAATAASSTATKPSASLPTGRDFERFDEANKPWWPLTFTAMLLFGSIGLNFYLGWIAHGIYQRYRALLMEVRNVRAATI